LCEGAPLDWEAVKALLRPHRLWPGGRMSRGAGTISWLQHWLARQPEGNRNSGLYWAAQRALDAGFDPWDLMRAAYQSGLDQPEIEATILSVVSSRHEQ
jgi:hypothetical protein